MSTSAHSELGCYYGSIVTTRESEKCREIHRISAEPKFFLLQGTLEMVLRLCTHDIVGIPLREGG